MVGAAAGHAGRWVAMWGRLVRDSGSEALPLSQVGGYVLGARALALGRRAGDRGGGEHDRRRHPRIRRPARLHRARASWLLMQLQPDNAIALPVAARRSRSPQPGRGRLCPGAAPRLDYHRPHRPHPRQRLGRAQRRRRGGAARRRWRRSIATAAACGRAFCCTSSAGSPAPPRSGWRCALPAQPLSFGAVLVDREPALRHPHRGVCRAQRGRGAGGRLYPARRRLRA